MIKKQSVRRIFFVIFTLLASNLFSQNLSFEKKIRIPLWADMDAYPGLKEVSKDPDSAAVLKNPNAENFKPYALPISELKKVAPYLLTGMVYGWNFSYTPSDKMRNVLEYFDCTEIHSFENDKKSIHYDEAWVENNRLYCWVEFDRNPQMQLIYTQWSSIQNQRIHGRGKAKLEEGFSGIQKATDDCVKNAIREYYRKVIKTKPKEIVGKVLIKNAPSVYVESGYYVIELDFFLETVKMREYKIF